MPTERAPTRAHKGGREGKPVNTPAGECVAREIERLREDAEGVRSPTQAAAVGPAKPRRASTKAAARKSVRSGQRSREIPVTTVAPAVNRARIKRKTSTKKTTNARAAGATRAARKRAMRARTR